MIALLVFVEYVFVTNISQHLSGQMEEQVLDIQNFQLVKCSPAHMCKQKRKNLLWGVKKSDTRFEWIRRTVGSGKCGALVGMSASPMPLVWLGLHSKTLSRQHFRSLGAEVRPEFVAKAGRCGARDAFTPPQ
jgi:hypothetical protein